METRYFDDEFTNEPPIDTPVMDSQLSATMQEKFAGFTYNASEGGPLSLVGSMPQNK